MCVDPLEVEVRIFAGQHFALLQVKFLLAHMLLKYRFELWDPHFQHRPVVAVVLQPLHGIPVRVLLRQPQSHNMPPAGPS
jgi:hypothetical protein